VVVENRLTADQIADLAPGEALVIETRTVTDGDCPHFG